MFYKVTSGVGILEFLEDKFKTEFCSFLFFYSYSKGIIFFLYERE